MLVALAEAGYEVTAFAPDMSEEAARSLSQHGVGAKPYRLDPVGINPIKDLLNTFALVRLLRSGRPDIVLCNNIKPVVFGTIAAALAGVKRRYALVGGLGYAFTDGPDSSGWSRKVARLVARVLYALAFRLCHLVIFHNRDDRDLLSRWKTRSKTRVAVVDGSGIDVTKFVPMRHPKTPVFIFVGRLLTDKGIREYLQAARQVRQSHPEARFLIIGDVDENPAAIAVGELVACVRAADVEWMGKVSDVRPYLNQSSVFVLPSYREGVPRSTLEAMACGLAVVTTDAPGCRETVIPGENGFLVPVGDANALANVLEDLCQNPNRIGAMGEASRRIAVDRFSVDKINREILTLLSEPVT